MDALHVAVAVRALAVVERDGTHDPCTGRVLTGFWLWDSSLVLVTHLAADNCAGLQLRGATVLELGAGTGLPGIAAVACLGAARCVLTDVRPLLPGRRANGLTAAQADVRELRWGDRLELEAEVRVDVVLMSHVGRVLRPGGHAGDGGHVARAVAGRCRRRHGGVGSERGAGQRAGVHGRAGRLYHLEGPR
ncbi:hypothetical protein BAE44_0012196 [Dichanthelium oligosanthes]|uniref:Protein N-lysine methyltransferase METTL21A n=1 Tax=Dichanthelium oligosanthes TaxID=888268 RepID=A0A1E5VNT9_9POAL|nr:hypothetical protein BAE44_0012196 [Dichanthelium oligosanthes]